MRKIKGMTQNERNVPAHLPDEQLPVEPKAPPGPVTIDSWAGQIRVEWDNTKPLTPLGQAPFFIQFLKVSGVFDALVAARPTFAGLHYEDLGLRGQLVVSEMSSAAIADGAV